MSGVKIVRIDIKEFRRFKDVQFEIGDCLTLIAGPNGTSKSTLLGMVAQPFSFGIFQGRTANQPDVSTYTTNYHEEILSQQRDLAGKRFKYDCKEVFRLSDVHDSNPDKYEYKVILAGECISSASPILKDGLLVRGQRRKQDTHIRFVAGPSRSSEEGEGNFPHPVIYLGMNRLYPLAVAKKISKGTVSVASEDIKWFATHYGHILSLSLDERKTHKTELLKSGDYAKNSHIGVAASCYDTESCSAGQDNLGQILTAVLSFKHLAKCLKTKYQGGLLLIDEIDATLHAKSQVALLRFLVAEAKACNLQIIATTHSLYMMQQVLQSELKDPVKLIYLRAGNGVVKNSGFTTYEEIANSLKGTVSPAAKPKAKIFVMCEDSETRSMLSGILGPATVGKYLKWVPLAHCSSGILHKISPLASDIPGLSQVIFLADGDMKSSLQKFRDANLCFLPGTERPENVAYYFLRNLDYFANLWNEIGRSGYDKDTAITDYGEPPTIGDGSTSKQVKAWYKTWYHKQTKQWKQGAAKKIFSAWALANKDETHLFCKKFLDLLKRLSHGTVSAKECDQILQKYT